MSTMAITGLGRIGRAAPEILLDGYILDVVAVNDIADAGHPGLPNQEYEASGATGARTS